MKSKFNNSTLSLQILLTLAFYVKKLELKEFFFLREFGNEPYVTIESIVINFEISLFCMRTYHRGVYNSTQYLLRCVRSTHLYGFCQWAKSTGTKDLILCQCPSYSGNNYKKIYKKNFTILILIRSTYSRSNEKN